MVVSGARRFAKQENRGVIKTGMSGILSINPSLE